MFHFQKMQWIMEYFKRSYRILLHFSSFHRNDTNYNPVIHIGMHGDIAYVHTIFQPRDRIVEGVAAILIKSLKFNFVS